jgi:hypothetical protein
VSLDFEKRKVKCPFCGEEFYPGEKQRIIKSKLLVAEGTDAHIFFIYACQVFRRDKEVQVMYFNGNTKLSSFLQELKTIEDFEKVESLVIARDAEKDASSAGESVKLSLEKAKLPCPSTPFSYATAGSQRTAFMLFPGPSCKKGTLEDLCLSTIQDDGDLIGCVEVFLGCVTETGEQLHQKHKNKLYTYLSGKDKYKGMKLGEATKAGAWNWGHAAFTPFKQIIQQM